MKLKFGSNWLQQVKIARNGAFPGEMKICQLQKHGRRNVRKYKVRGREHRVKNEQRGGWQEN